MAKLCKFKNYWRRQWHRQDFSWVELTTHSSSRHQNCPLTPQDKMAFLLRCNLYQEPRKRCYLNSLHFPGHHLFNVWTHILHHFSAILGHHYSFRMKFFFYFVIICDKLRQCLKLEAEFDSPLIDTNAKKEMEIKIEWKIIYSITIGIATWHQWKFWHDNVYKV